MNNNFTPIEDLEEGQEFTGQQQYIQVLYMTPDPDIPAPMVRLFIWCGDMHRVVKAEYYIVLELVNQILDPDYNGELEQDVDVVAMWADDCDVDRYTELMRTSMYPVDCETGEVYDWLP